MVYLLLLFTFKSYIEMPKEMVLDGRCKMLVYTIHIAIYIQFYNCDTCKKGQISGSNLKCNGINICVRKSWYFM